MGGRLASDIDTKRVSCWGHIFMSVFFQEKKLNKKSLKIRGFFIVNLIKIICEITPIYLDRIKLIPCVIFRYLFFGSKNITTSIIIFKRVDSKLFALFVV